MKMKEIISKINGLKHITYFPPETVSLVQHNRMTREIAQQFDMDIYEVKILSDYYTPGFYCRSKYHIPGIAGYLQDELDNLKIKRGYVMRYQTQKNKTVGYGICYSIENDTADRWYGVIIT